jgi:hypothetical protein
MEYCFSRGLIVTRIAIIVLLLLSLCSGCVPYPHFERLTPAVTGTITMNGQPLSGAIIKISDTSSFEGGDGKCSKNVMATASSDSYGHFKLKNGNTFRFFGVMFNVYRSELCIVANGETYLGYYIMTDFREPGHISLQCSLGITNESSNNITGKDEWCPGCPCQIMHSSY